MSETTEATEATRTQAKTREGVVVSDKMDKTAVVSVNRRLKHRRYHKFIQFSKKYMVHDEHNEASIGDRVLIAESRRRSARKRWALRKVLEKAVGQTPRNG